MKKRSRLVHLLLCAASSMALACSDGGSSVDCADGLVGFAGPNGDLCVDALEVTNASFAAFLTEYGNTCGGSQECMHVDEPGSHISQSGASFVVAAGYESLPVVQVTFGGAEAFCTSASKFLCPDAMWVAACEAPGGSPYPYGGTYDATACNGADYGAAAPVAVGSIGTCEGGSGDLFDMSGNVYEWTDACGAGSCLIRGGGFDSAAADLACDGSHTMDGPSGHREDLGFRCCADAL